VCPPSAERYRGDAYQLLAACLRGGKGMAEHPAVFGTFTAPSFGLVHTRPLGPAGSRGTAGRRARPLRMQEPGQERPGRADAPRPRERFRLATPDAHNQGRSAGAGRADGARGRLSALWTMVAVGVVKAVMVRRWVALLGALVLAAVTLSRCAGDESPPASATGDGGPAGQRSNLARVIESTRAACAVGERPGYFVPGLADGPLALLGCARLGVSGKRVEFSGNLARIDGGRHACVNPAYSGSDLRGLYIPAICKLDPSLARFAVRDAAQPRQGVRGYAYVIWGTAGASTDVVASFAGGTAKAAVLRVGADLARKFGESPFSLFVVELPLSAACVPVTISGRGSDGTEGLPPQPELCERARGPGAVGSG